MTQRYVFARPTVHMIDTFVVRVHQRGACIVDNNH
jgi:hypothetical protein